MRLTPGVRVGQYEVLSALGAGGMGEVFRARDTRLNRDVALKVLPDLFAADRDRVARFEREAQLLASLNHPHIAAIYRFEEAAGVCALVLELVEGPTLAEWVTYESAESGRPDIFVQSFPSGAGKSQVSTDGGSQGLWRADGREFFYISTDGQLMAVPISSVSGADAIAFGTPTRLFPIRVESMPQGGVSRRYAPAADGKKFLLSAFVERNASPLTLILRR